MTRRIFMCLCLFLWTLPVKAQEADALFDRLRLPEMISVMRAEGLDYGETLAMDMFAGGASPAWEEMLSDIYDTTRMETLVRARFVAALQDVDTAPLMAFFASDTGREIVTLELSAREAMIDDAVEQAARDTWRLMQDDAPRLEQITRFVEANDLVEANVAGALNASYRFYAGMVEGGGLEMSEADILTDVWSQEEATREDTREWLFGFLLMAYQPLSADQMDSYIALSGSEEGRALNNALFDAFNRMYDDISFGLGLAVAQQMRGQDL
jgi:hypothetical protein